MPNKQINAIISNLTEVFEGEPWYGTSVMKKLETIDWQTVNEKKYGTKSIAVLLGHMISWRVFVLKKLQGDEAFAIQIDNHADWPNIHITSANEWGELLEELMATQRMLLSLLANHADALLEQKVPGKNDTFRFLLEGIVQHDVYHLGQIALLNAMLGS